MPESRPLALPKLPEFPAVRALELFAVIASVVICDLTIYRGEGYFGLAALFLALPVFLALGSPIRSWNWSLLVMIALQGGVIARLAWCGSPGAVVIGIACLIGYAMCLAGLPPYITRAI